MIHLHISGRCIFLPHSETRVHNWRSTWSSPQLLVGHPKTKIANKILAPFKDFHLFGSIPQGMKMYEIKKRTDWAVRHSWRKKRRKKWSYIVGIFLFYKRLDKYISFGFVKWSKTSYNINCYWIRIFRFRSLFSFAESINHFLVKLYSKEKLISFSSSLTFHTYVHLCHIFRKIQILAMKSWTNNRCESSPGSVTL